ncbi:MAG: DUF2157 domain-containing protein [Thermoguttaceae bacterium]|nr:DUF2157 domain-containing protein [Thermoguttaceae bacterium]
MQKLTHASFQFLEKESREWVQDRLITEETRGSILARYEVPSRTESLQRTGLLTILSLGVFLLGLSIFLLVSFNWAAMTAVEKLTIVFGSMAVAYIAGGVFGARKHPVLSEVAFFFGAILFGVGIWQIGQIFHVSAHAPDLLWYWAVGSLALAIGLRTPVVHALVCALLLIWIPWEICGYSHLAPGFLRLFGGTWAQNVPNVCWSVPVLLALGYWVTPWLEAGSRSRATVRFFYAIVLLWWIAWFPGAWNGPYGTSFYYVVCGTLLTLVPRLISQVRAAGKLSPASQLLVVVGTLMFGAGLIPFSFNEIHWYRYNPDLSFYAFPIALEFLFLLTLALMSAKAPARKFVRQNLLLILTGIYAACVLFLIRYTSILKFDTWFGGLVAAQNIFMFVLALSFIHFGLHKSVLSAFTFGVLYFLLWSVLRYFDLFGDVGGMLGAAGLFFFCAVVMFGFAFYWFKAKKGA